MERGRLGETPRLPPAPMVHATPDSVTRRLSVFYATDCRVTGMPGDLGVSTMIPIAEGADAGVLLVEQMRWALFVRMVAPRHTAAVASPRA